jgi:hypothetical protein
MDEPSTITVAAQLRDWRGCEKIMFRLLSMCTREQQLAIASQALVLYQAIWFAKHPKAVFPEGDCDLELDAADAEFENAICEVKAGKSQKIEYFDRVRHFATAIRSSVLAVQINRWIGDFPDEYRLWREGRAFKGPTFLEDPEAEDAAAKAWSWIDSLFNMVASRPGTLSHHPRWGEAEIVETEYAKWNATLL